MLLLQRIKVRAESQATRQESPYDAAIIQNDVVKQVKVPLRILFDPEMMIVSSESVWRLPLQVSKEMIHYDVLYA